VRNLVGPYIPGNARLLDYLLKLDDQMVQLWIARKDAEFALGNLMEVRVRDG